MNRIWAILFLLVPVLGIASYLMAAWGVGPLRGLWLTENLTTAGETIDFLFLVIHVICAGVLLLTGVWLAISIYQFGNSKKPAVYISHHHWLEVIWTVIPAGILIFIALFQMQSWEANKLNRPVELVEGVSRPKPPLIKVVARRFGWEIYHAGLDKQLDTIDDLYIENEMRVPFGEDVVLQLESRDVIHSFFVPDFRLKQDVVPGLQQFVWFNAKRPAETTIVCAELCGWGHYTMQGKVILISRAEYDEWLQETSVNSPVRQKIEVVNK